MADIDSPLAIAFCNEHVRPMCERLRAIEAELEDFANRWNEVSSLFPADSSPVVDGRDDVIPLTGYDITLMAGDAATALAALQTDSDLKNSFAKPCVRPFYV